MWAGLGNIFRHANTAVFALFVPFGIRPREGRDALILGKIH